MTRFDRGETKNPVSVTPNNETASRITADETFDTLFQGKLKFFQSRHGYRCSLDALLLADFALCLAGEHVADLGAGNGVVAFMLAYLHPSLSITGLEIQPAMVDRACRNVQANGFVQRVAIRQGDVRKIQDALAPGSFATVVCNPPYRRMSAGRTLSWRGKKDRPARNCSVTQRFFARGGLLAGAERTYGSGLSGRPDRRLAAIHAQRRSRTEAFTDGSFICRCERFSGAGGRGENGKEWNRGAFAASGL